ncbi:MAG: hypothetical protein ACU84H_05275 [Gammaproteobacteria bacterium]
MQEGEGYEKKARFNKLIFSIGPLLWLVTSAAWGVDWQAVTGKKLTLFYPGQASWEWLLTDHKGAAHIKRGQIGKTEKIVR